MFSFHFFSFTFGNKWSLNTSKLRSRQTSRLVTKMRGDFLPAAQAAVPMVPGFSHLLLPPRARASKGPQKSSKITKSRKDWKKSLEKVRTPNYHSLISAFSCKQFKRKQSKMHQRYHKPSGCLLKREKHWVQPGTKVSMATVNLDPHWHYLCNISSQKDPPTTLPSKF